MWNTRDDRYHHPACCICLYGSCIDKLDLWLCRNALPPGDAEHTRWLSFQIYRLQVKDLTGCVGEDGNDWDSQLLCNFGGEMHIVLLWVFCEMLLLYLEEKSMPHHRPLKYLWAWQWINWDGAFMTPLDLAWHPRPCLVIDGSSSTRRVFAQGRRDLLLFLGLNEIHFFTSFPTPPPMSLPVQSSLTDLKVFFLLQCFNLFALT